MKISPNAEYLIDGLLNEIRTQERTPESSGDLLIRIIRERVEYNAGIIKMLDDMYKEYLINRGKREQPGQKMV